MLIDQWNREGQHVIYLDSGNWTEALVTWSRTTLDCRIKHYGTDNEGNDIMFYEEDFVQVIEEHK